MKGQPGFIFLLAFIDPGTQPHVKLLAGVCETICMQVGQMQLMQLFEHARKHFYDLYFIFEGYLCVHSTDAIPFYIFKNKVIPGNLPGFQTPGM